MRRALKTYPVIAIDVEILRCSMHLPSLSLSLPLPFPFLSFSLDVTFRCTNFVRTQLMFIIIICKILSVTYVSTIFQQKNIHLFQLLSNLMHLLSNPYK